ncbi:uncharacterized protein [Solanum lycopersicum]|uniref:uncharacterized protein n=1 Tax=Solanum lycopersicum TaxID=4081 RepID=UPI003748FAFE
MDIEANQLKKIKRYGMEYQRGFAALWRSLRDSGMHNFISSIFICSFQLPITLIVTVPEEHGNIHVAILFRCYRGILADIKKGSKLTIFC